MKRSRVGSFRGGGGGGGGGGPQPTDLLVCFPTRSHLTLMPKPICSPSRANTKSSPRAAHLFRTPTNTNPNRTRSQLGSDPMSEPTSPKVTCAGQIKVRTNKSRTAPKPKPKHNHNWIESLGLKKDVMNFLGALRSLRFNMQCFGSFRGAVDCCSDDEEEDDDEEEASRLQARTVFSKWFMVLDENNDGDDDNEDHVGHEKAYREEDEEEQEEEAAAAAAQPPKNALMLMRCRSAPTKGLEVEEKEEEEEGNKGGDEERLMLMSYAPDFFKLSTEVAKETWVVGSFDPLARSRSWRR